MMVTEPVMEWYQLSCFLASIVMTTVQDLHRFKLESTKAMAVSYEPSRVPSIHEAANTFSLQDCMP